MTVNMQVVDRWMIALVIFAIIVLILYCLTCTKWFDELIANFPDNIKAYTAWYIKKFRKWRSKK